MRARIALLTVCLIALPLDAAAEWRRAATLSAAQWAEIRQAAVARGRVARLVERHIPRFLLVANENRVVICNLGPQGLDCFTDIRGRQCPSTVEVRIEGAASPANIPITCTGPDAQGICDCDFTPQG